MADVPIEVATFRMLKEEIAAVLDTVTARERTILELRFGLVDDRPRTLQEVGLAVGLTRERVRQIEVSTLMRLRHPSRSVRLRAFLDED